MAPGPVAHSVCVDSSTTGTVEASKMINSRSDQLQVTWEDGLTHSFHPMWLRERSFEPTNKDPRTGHRLDEVALLPLDLSIGEAVESERNISLVFSDGHSCTYALDDLRRQVEHPYPVDLTGAKQLWRSSVETWPLHDAEAVLSSDDACLALTADLARVGFVIVDALGSQEDDLGRLCARFGPIRPTNWGLIADVKSIASAWDLSMTGRALEPHVDNPYRLPGPGYILLHCLINSANGGDSFLIDGFGIADQVRCSDPEAFDVLCTTNVGFHYADHDAILDHCGPLIELGPDGALFRVRFHNRADQVPAHDKALLDRYYRARRTMAELIWSEDNNLRFRLEPGQVLFIDNYRLFHGRTKIDLASGDRHLRQCYLDRDTVSSCQKRILRTLQHV